MALGRNPSTVVLAHLPKLPLAELRSLWASCFGSTQPPQRRLLIRELAWRTQEQQEGGFDAQTSRLLQSAMREAAAGERKRSEREAKDKPSVSPARRRRPRASPWLVPAARLVREWRGQRHEVVVVDRGSAYHFRGQTYRSLTEIAHVITGSHRSGPRFFGLVSRGTQVAKPGDHSGAKETRR
ncbi:MAG: DUF2924 domain-containing protein [Phycisphaeraceae bacterium]|nr:DUF2924 domain-containing protein [Phycisphaeraceae bacterium]